MKAFFAKRPYLTEITTPGKNIEKQIIEKKRRKI